VAPYPKPPHLGLGEQLGTVPHLNQGTKTTCYAPNAQRGALTREYGHETRETDMWGTPVGMTWHNLVQWRSWPTTSLPPAIVHVGRGGQQRGAAPTPPLDTATAVSDTLIIARHGRFQCAEGGVSAVA
jgi:hypothetical protein